VYFICLETFFNIKQQTIFLAGTVHCPQMGFPFDDNGSLYSRPIYRPPENVARQANKENK